MAATARPCSVADGGAKRLSDFVVDLDSSLRRGLSLSSRLSTSPAHHLSPLPPAGCATPRERERALERKPGTLPPPRVARSPPSSANIATVYGRCARIRIVATDRARRRVPVAVVSVDLVISTSRAFTCTDWNLKFHANESI